jgi:tetratricopeptide (TPR) repeat protein
LLRVARGFFLLNRDPSSAASDFAHALELDPANARALLGQAHLARRDDPRAALALVDRALLASPRFFDALQLRALLRAHLGDSSAVSDAESLAETPTPLNLYNAACALSVLSETARDPRLRPLALRFLRRALDAGFPPADAAADPDLAPLRGEAEFQSLVAPRPKHTTP